MSILIGVGVVTTITVFYLGKKGWQALHNAVGITPGVLMYQDPNAPLTSSPMSWQSLNLDKKYLEVLSDKELIQLQRLDKKVASYEAQQQALPVQNITPALTEQQFVLHKMLYTRLPEILVSHYHLMNTKTDTKDINNNSQAEASRLLQEVLGNIERRVDTLLAQSRTQHLQDLKIMKSYMDSHDS